MIMSRKRLLLSLYPRAIDSVIVGHKRCRRFGIAKRKNLPNQEVFIGGFKASRIIHEIIQLRQLAFIFNQLLGG